MNKKKQYVSSCYLVLLNLSAFNGRDDMVANYVRGSSS